MRRYSLQVDHVIPAATHWKRFDGEQNNRNKHTYSGPEVATKARIIVSDLPVCMLVGPCHARTVRLCALQLKL